MKIIKKAKRGKVVFKNTNSINHLDPIFKWTGGKRREIAHFKQYFPSFVDCKEKFTYVEPFIGAGAVYWYLNNVNGQNIINDFDQQVMNFYREFCKSEPNFVSELQRVSAILDHDSLSKNYYYFRNQDKRGGLTKLSNTEQAIRFFIVNQLAFSGMRRFNSSGEFNVPFGHYKRLNANVITSPEHQLLLDRTEICCGDFEIIMNKYDNKNTFQFLDPPYTRIFKEYSANNNFGETEHIRLSHTIKNMKNASIMMIIDKSPFTEDLYKGYIKSSYTLKYGVNIKNRFNTAVEHLIICNY